MSGDSHDLDDWADHPQPGDDAEAEALTADIASVMAGRLVVPAAIMWWRSRRERQAEQEVAPSETTGQTRRPRWFEL